MTRILLVDDHELFRDGLRALLSSEHDLEIVAEAGNARAALQAADTTPFDVALLDIRMPDGDGISLLRELRRRGHHEPVLMLSMHEERDFVREAMAAGAAGYALKRAPSTELARAVRAVASGGHYVAPSIAPLLEDQAPGTLDALSRREREIFHLLADGKDNAEIGRLLCISEKTVETHRTRIFRKLAVRSLAELVRLAARHQLLSA